MTLSSLFTFSFSPPPLAWRASLRRVGWWPVAAAAVAVALGLLLAETVWRENNSFSALRILEMVLPIFAGMHAAFLFSPEDEPPLELLAAAPRSLAWLLWERLLVFLSLYLAVGLVGTVAQAILTRTAVFSLLWRWLPPFMWLIGLGVFLTLLTRQGVLSTLLVMLTWGGFAIGGAIMIYGCRLLLPLDIFLPPDAALVTTGMYTYNRVWVLLSGVLLLVAGTRLSQDESRLLGERGVARVLRQRPKLLPDRLSYGWLVIGLLAFYWGQPHMTWLAIVIATIFMLRFTRTQHPDPGLIIGLGGITAVAYAAWYQQTHLSDFCHAIFAGQYALAFMLPLIVDRLLWSYGRGRFTSTAVFPMAWVLVALIAWLYQHVVGPFAYSQFDITPMMTKTAVFSGIGAAWLASSSNWLWERVTAGNQGLETT